MRPRTALFITEKTGNNPSRPRAPDWQIRGAGGGRQRRTRRWGAGPEAGAPRAGGGPLPPDAAGSRSAVIARRRHRAGPRGGASAARGCGSLGPARRGQGSGLRRGQEVALKTPLEAQAPILPPWEPLGLL